MGQYWTKKKDHEDLDDKIATPWAEKVGHGNIEWPSDDDLEENKQKKVK